MKEQYKCPVSVKSHCRGKRTRKRERAHKPVEVSEKKKKKTKRGRGAGGVPRTMPERPNIDW
jgi:hypothetical protein